MSIIFTKHALDQMQARSISEEIIFTVLKTPDNTQLDTFGNHISQKMINDYLYRVVYSLENNDMIIITSYKTSKIKKYEK